MTTPAVIEPYVWEFGTAFRFGRSLQKWRVPVAHVVRSWEPYIGELPWGTKPDDPRVIRRGREYVKSLGGERLPIGWMYEGQCLQVEPFCGENIWRATGFDALPDGMTPCRKCAERIAFEEERRRQQQQPDAVEFARRSFELLGTAS